MYKVTLYDNPDEQNGIVIHHANVGGNKVEGTVKKEINKIDTFTFGMTLENPGYGKVRPFKTFLTVLNTRKNKTEFKGRVYGPSESMDETGMVEVSYVCEGELSYLTDSVQRHLEFRGTPVEGFTTIVEYHNTQIEDYKRFEVGRVEVTDPNDFLYFYLNSELGTLDAIFEKLIDKLGGELYIRYENGVRYLDWLERIGYDSPTDIKLAKNLMNMSREVDPSEVVTRLTPLGERIESEDETATDASQERLTISSVNSGKPYIDRLDLIELFGIQGGSEVWDDVTQPSRLMTNGRHYLNNQKLVLVQYQVAALDLATINLDIDQFETGNSHYMNNPVMAIEERLRIIGTQKDINSPENSGLTIGDKFLNRTDYQVQQKKSASRVTELQGELDSQSRRVYQLRTAYAQISEDIGHVQESLLSIDVENMPAELQGIHDQLDTIAQSIVNLPVYGVATPFEMGYMSAEDKAKLDRIDVNSFIDLDMLVNELNNLTLRVEELETPEEPEGAE